MEPVAILGYHDGAAGQVETWFEQTSGDRIACFVYESGEPFSVDVAAENQRRVSRRTSFPVEGTFKGRPFIVTLEWANKLKSMGIRKVLPLTPENSVRKRQIQICQEQGFELVSAIHPSVLVLAEAIIAPGVWINAGSIIGYKAEIQSGVIINTGASLDHHNVLEICCQVDPGVTTAGNVTLRTCAHVHTGATLINRIEIGEGSIIGAGSVVLESIPPHSTAVGVPARVI
ncbi:MAG TPA: acetyltransferase [Novimethylophilus sp.]|jgi:serine O-acetyltransferase|uniref:acetyltransferase n=1 Tax=Novimethylophilus sp. TaxID=2137426 RepID=UPI002F42E890